MVQSAGLEAEKLDMQTEMRKEELTKTDGCKVDSKLAQREMENRKFNRGIK